MGCTGVYRRYAIEAGPLVDYYTQKGVVVSVPIVGGKEVMMQAFTDAFLRPTE
jgi:hypothetical protein